MRRLALAVVLFCIPFAPSSSSAATAPAETIPGQALVKFRAGTSSVVIAAAHARVQARIVRTIPVIGHQQIAFDSSLPLDTVISSYRNDPAVVAAEPNYVARVVSANDPCLSGSCAGQQKQWSVAMTAGSAAWTHSVPTAQEKTALARITVAVLDTKVDASHRDFANSGSSSTDARNGGQLDLVNARDWIPASQQSGGAAYHGSYVAGLVAAATNNGFGVASAGSRATILPLTVVNGAGTADAAALADAIVYAWQKGARVINLSLGLTSNSTAVHDAIISVTTAAHPSLVIAAAGNNTGSAAFYPGSYPQVMSVAGTNRSDQPAACSNHNANVSVSAPAEQVVSLNTGGGFTAPACGTSAAAPQASGLAALLFAQQPTRTPADVRRIIERSADDLGAAGRDDRFGHGRINVDRALRSAAIQISTVRAGVPTATNGFSTITAVATAAAGQRVQAARVFIDSLDATPASLQPSDGAFGSAAESVRGNVGVPASISAGPHPIYVQAFDGSTWGPVAVGVLLIDAKPPVISGLTASNASRLTAQPALIRFSVGDDTSPSLAIGIQVFDAQNKEVFRDSRTGVSLGAVTYQWSPSSATLPGSYQVKVIAADLSGKSTATLVGTLVT